MLQQEEQLAELEFTNKNLATTSVTLQHKEYGNQTSTYQETVKVQGAVEWVSASTTLGGNIGLYFYVNTVLKNPNIAGEALVNTAKALYAYNKLAESYFN